MLFLEMGMYKVLPVNAIKENIIMLITPNLSQQPARRQFVNLVSWKQITCNYTSFWVRSGCPHVCSIIGACPCSLVLCKPKPTRTPRSVLVDTESIIGSVSWWIRVFGCCLAIGRRWVEFCCPSSWLRVWCSPWHSPVSCSLVSYLEAELICTFAFTNMCV